MRSPRLRAIILLGALVLLGTSCERMAVGPQIAGELRHGRAFAATLIQSARTTPADSILASAAIALGYLERHRLGLGGPFRLIDYALQDPRLPDSTRQSLAWALLARTLDGDGDQIDPIVLDSLDDPSALASRAEGIDQLRLIAQAIQDVHDPRAGELAVRLAYTIVAAEHRLRPDAPLIAARVAALLRDRALASADARDLLREAWKRNGDPLAMLALWREERRFRVEQPPMERIPAGAELEAMALAPRLVREIHDIDDHADAAQAEHEPASLLGAAAPELARIARVTNMPPETPVIVSLASYREPMTSDSTLSRPERWARFHFAMHARNEEMLAAAHALIEARAPGIAVERATLAAAVALRAYAQEAPWFPGDGGPSTRELIDRFGLASVTFDPGTPEAWMPYYRGMLATALEDIERVVPSLTLDGLHIRFGESPMHDAALALHDPRRRTIYLPLATGAGTIAHELAHDIDWQAARTRYAVRGDYATDRAVREARGGWLAASMRGLTAASLTAGWDRGSLEPLSARPTEVFARSVDWFIAVSLAREGRIDGYLSSVQDDLLTGYVTVTPPDVTGEGSSALISILDDVTPPAPTLRTWFLTRYGPGRALTPYDLVRRVLEAPLDSADDHTASLVELVAPVVRARDAALRLVDAGSARLAGAGEGGDTRVTGAREQLVELAARARARGIMRARGTMLAAEAAWRWTALAPYAASQPFVLADAFHPALEGLLAERAQALDALESR